MRDLTRDGFGRLWALSASSIALVSPAPKVVAPSRPNRGSDSDYEDDES